LLNANIDHPTALIYHPVRSSIYARHLRDGWFYILLVAAHNAYGGTAFRLDAAYSWTEGGIQSEKAEVLWCNDIGLRH
jgi:hypothetical protein